MLRQETGPRLLEPALAISSGVQKVRLARIAEQTTRAVVEPTADQSTLLLLEDGRVVVVEPRGCQCISVHQASPNCRWRYNLTYGTGHGHNAWSTQRLEQSRKSQEKSPASGEVAMSDDAELLKAGVQGTVEGALKPFADLIQAVLGPPADEMGLILQDTVATFGYGIRLSLLMRQVRLFKRTQEMLNEMGVEPRKVPMKLLLPIIQNGSLEEDDELQDKWAALLANNAAGKYTESVFPEILKQLSPADAYLLKMCFYEALTEPQHRFPPPTYSIPQSIRKWREAVTKSYPKLEGYPTVKPREPVSSIRPPVSELSLGNLIRLGLISSQYHEKDVHPLAPSGLGLKPGETRVDSEEGVYLLSGIGLTFAYACEDPTKIEAASLAQFEYIQI